MSRLINHRQPSKVESRNLLLTVSAAVLLASCQLNAQQPQPRVATSFWKIATPAYSDMPGYTVIRAEGKTRPCYPVTEWFDPYPGSDVYHKLHHHGVAAESELMAYRIYFDETQTIDVYCKRTPRLELATSYWYPNDRQLAAHYGDDIIRVGGTIGVGSVNYWRDGQLRHFKEVGERQQWILSQNDSVAVISISDVDWSVPKTGKRLMVNFHADYTLCAGHRDMRCDVSVSKPVDGLCTGVQAIPRKGSGQTEDSQWISEQLPNGTLLASWGTDWPVNDTVKYAKETVGLAVFVPKAYAGETVQNESNLLCLLKQSAAIIDYIEVYQAHFYLTCVGATKEDHPVAKTATEWFAFVRQWAEGLE